jgi:hypothetical protein
MVFVVFCIDKREHSFLTFLMQEIDRLVLLLKFRSALVSQLISTRMAGLLESKSFIHRPMTMI